MERRGKSSPAHWRLCGYVNPVRSNIRMGHMRSLARPGDGMRDLPRSLAATQGQDRSPFNTEPGLRSSRFCKKLRGCRGGGVCPRPAAAALVLLRRSPAPLGGRAAPRQVLYKTTQRKGGRHPGGRPFAVTSKSDPANTVSRRCTSPPDGRCPLFKSGGLPPPPGCAFLSGPPGGLSGGGTFPGRRGGRPRCSGRNSSAGRRGGTA